MAKTQFGADENALVSPFSLADGLSMLNAGARGKTAQQIKEDLQLTDWKDPKDAKTYVGRAVFRTALCGIKYLT